MATNAKIKAIRDKIAAGQKYYAQQVNKGNSETATGAAEKISLYEAQLDLANAQRYESNMSAAGNEAAAAGAASKIQEYQGEIADLTGGSADPEEEEEVEEELPEPETPSLTGNMPIDQANILSNILNSPLYTEELKNNYLQTYLPGLTKANFDINTAKAAELENEVSRRQYQSEAVRRVAGDYASRGMRTPEMANRGFAPIQQATEQARTSAERNITGLEGQKDLLYGAGALDGETFMSDPTKFGSVGQSARQQAVTNLQQLPQQYGLTQVENANTSPIPDKPATPDTPASQRPKVVASGLTRSQLMAKLEAGKKYRANMAAQGKQKFVDGADKKIQTYQDEVDAFDGGY